MYMPPAGITKVKPPCLPYPMAGMPLCILPTTRMGQWEIGAQVLFARAKGTVQWPRNNWWLGGFSPWIRDVDFNDDLMLPSHQVFVDLSIKYQFRPNWAIQYSVLGTQLNGGGWPDFNNSTPFVFGNFLFTWGNPLNTIWQHAYHRAVLVYDAVKTCRSTVSVFGGWAHTEDRLDVNCVLCGFQTNTLSKSNDCGIAGIALQRCIRTACNGSTFSLDCKAAGIFYDDVEGYDAQAGLRYSIPLNVGRWGYAKGGYRVVSIQKGQQDLLLKTQLEGGFVEFGFIF